MHTSWKQWALRLVWALIYAFNVNALLLIALSCGSVAASNWLGLTYNVEFSFIALGITFPLTFNITQAFTRRERALSTLAELKASCVALYWQHRDWAQDDGFPESLGNDRSKWAINVANVIVEFLSNMEQYMLATEGYESLSEIRLSAKRRGMLALLLADTSTRDDRAYGRSGGGGGGGGEGCSRRGLMSDEEAPLNSSFQQRVQKISEGLDSNRHLKNAYRCLSQLAVMNEYLTFKAKYARGGEGGLSRTSQFLRYMVASMEQLRMIKIYRTPFMLRHCTSMLIHIGAVVLGPYFSHIAVCDEAWSLHSGTFCPAPYVMAVIFSVICMLLLSVQDAAEVPFDGTGLDDVFLELAGEFADILDLGPPVQPLWDDSGDCFAPVRAGGKGKK